MKVSIVIPAYNAAPFLERAIQSAIQAGSQVQGGWEVIIVDNGSTDATGELITAAVQAHRGRIRSAFCSRPGASAARNLGAAMSTGEWLQFLDADDTLAPDKINHQLRLAGGAEWVVGAYRHLYPDGSTEDSLPHPDLWLGLFHDFRTGHTISNLVHHSAFDTIGGWNESLPSNQDPDLHYRLLRAAVPYVIDTHVASFYHHHTGPRITSSDPARKMRVRVRFFADANHYLLTSRPTYWRQHAPYFLGALLRAVRMLATYDLPAAEVAYADYFGPDRPWPLPDQPLELTPRYTRLYPTLGFAALERSRLFLARYLPPTLKQLLKS